VLWEELEGRKCGVETEHAEFALGEDAYVLDTRGTTGTVPGQRDNSLVAHVWEEDGIESERCEQATFLVLSGGSESTLDGQGTAVGNVSEVGDVGYAADRAARVEDSDGCVAQAEHGFSLDDNKVRVMIIRVWSEGPLDLDLTGKGKVVSEKQMCLIAYKGS
jgi:hypothetical protein